MFDKIFDMCDEMKRLWDFMNAPHITIRLPPDYLPNFSDELEDLKKNNQSDTVKKNK